MARPRGLAGFARAAHTVLVSLPTEGRISKKKSSIRRAKDPARPQHVSRQEFVAALHRRPCAWDVVVYELCLALTKAYAAVRSGLTLGALRLRSQAVPVVGLRLANGFEVALRRLLLGDAAIAAAADAGRLDTVAAELARVARDDFDPLLRKFVEDLDDQILPRPDRELERLVGRLEEATAAFLGTRCGPGGDLQPLAAAPLGPAGKALPDNGLPPDPATSSGSVARDIIDLASTVRAEDDAVAVKRKLVHFVRHDPWLAEECMVDVLGALDVAGGDEAGEDVRATDAFVFRPTRIDGRTPIELFIERQPAMPEAQRRRLERWNNEAFTDVFHVRRLEPPFVAAADVRFGREYRLLATRPVMKVLRRGDLFMSRVVPWDDHWALSGVLEVVGHVDEPGLPEVRRLLLQGPSPRRPDPNDPAVQSAKALLEEQYRAWVELFGADELTFASGRELGAAVDRFYHHWNEEQRDPQTGRTRAEQYELDHNRPAPEPSGVLPEDLLEARDVGVTVDAVTGMGFLTNFGLFRSALESGGPPTAPQVAIVLEYLRDPSVEPVAFLKARQRHPQRLAELLRLALRDEQFDLQRDFDRLLRKYKGEALRSPQLEITVVDKGALG